MGTYRQSFDQDPSVAGGPRTASRFRRLIPAALVFAVSTAGVLALDTAVPAGASTVHRGVSVTAVSPAGGMTLGGTTVTISGTGFKKVKSVQFGGYSAQSFTVVSSTEITAVSPSVPNTTTRVDITVTAKKKTSRTSTSDEFDYFPPPGWNLMG